MARFLHIYQLIRKDKFLLDIENKSALSFIWNHVYLYIKFFDITKESFTFHFLPFVSIAWDGERNSNKQFHINLGWLWSEIAITLDSAKYFEDWEKI
jgi:hypothetical protein